MVVLSTAKGPVTANIYAADGTLLLTHNEVEAISLYWVQEENKRRLQADTVDEGFRILAEAGPEAFIEWLFGG